MLINSHGSSMPSHSNEVEHRLTVVETGQEAVEETIASHAKRITFLERLLQGLIYAMGALAAGKSGDAVDTLISLLKAKL
jgi:hypothetical protein